MNWNRIALGVGIAVGLVATSVNASAQEPAQDNRGPAMAAETPYQSGDNIPPGYRLESHSNTGLAVAGGVSAGGIWLGTAVVGMLIELSDYTTEFLGCPIAAAVDDAAPPTSANDSAEDGLCDDDNHWPMVIPLVGPFITMSTANTQGGDTAALAAVGSGQIIGLGLMIVGLATGEDVLVRTDVGGVELSIVPEAVGGTGMSMVGTF